jgi:hypothetical protein
MRRTTHDAPPRRENAEALDAATRTRRSSVLALTMSERLARLHAICLQATGIKDAARPRP